MAVLLYPCEPFDDFAGIVVFLLIRLLYRAGKRIFKISALQQYGLLLGLAVGTAGLVLCLYALARTLGKVRQEPGKDVPATSGQLSRDPVWVIAVVFTLGIGLAAQVLLRQLN